MDEGQQKWDAVKGCLEHFTKEYSDLLPVEIPKLETAPTALEFLRDYVSPNIPFVLRNGVSHWPACKKWNNLYLRNRLQDKMCTVAVTPNGYADAVLGDKFVLPEERTISFNEFLDEMKAPRHSHVFYLQKQNNCLVDEYSCLIDDIDYHIPWATEALGDFPEAANFWMGDTRAVTSLHKDNYENIYCVVRGFKEFILYPPFFAVWAPYKSFKKSQYYFEDDEYKIKDLDGMVKWIPFDPKSPNYEEYPMLQHTKRYRLVLKAGDVLYLPSLWYHHVQQSHACIAINYWYEMKYDVKYSYFYLLDKLGQISVSSSKSSNLYDTLGNEEL